MPCTVHDFKPIDKSIPIPLYYQLKSQFKELIANGVLVQGDATPPENDMADYLHISRPTVRQALNELVVEGYLERKKGKGTYVSLPKIDAKFLNQLKTFNDEMKEKGMEPSTTLLSMMCVGPRKEINEKLGIGMEDALIELRRIRSADNEPILYQETYLPYDCCKKLLDEDFSKVTLYATLERIYGLRVSRVTREIEAKNAAPQTAKLLHIATNDAIALVRTIAYTDEGKAIEYSISRYCGNRVKFSVELYR